MKNTWVIILITALVVGGAAFFGGTKYAQGKSVTATGTANFAGRTRGQGLVGGANRGMGAGMGGGFTAGEVLTKDASSLTLKLSDGGSKVVLFSTSTPVRKTTEGTLDDVAIGNQITVIGQAGSDGSIMASSIQQGNMRMGGALQIPSQRQSQ